MNSKAVSALSISSLVLASGALGLALGLYRAQLDRDDHLQQAIKVDDPNLFQVVSRPSGEVGLVIVDPRTGEPRIIIGLDVDGTALISLADREGTGRFEVSARDGSPGTLIIRDLAAER